MSALDWMLKAYPEVKEREDMRRIIGRYGLTGTQQVPCRIFLCIGRKISGSFLLSQSICVDAWIGKFGIHHSQHPLIRKINTAFEGGFAQ